MSSVYGSMHIQFIGNQNYPLQGKQVFTATEPSAYPATPRKTENA